MPNLGNLFISYCVPFSGDRFISFFIKEKGKNSKKNKNEQENNKEKGQIAIRSRIRCSLKIPGMNWISKSVADLGSTPVFENNNASHPHVQTGPCFVNKYYTCIFHIHKHKRERDDNNKKKYLHTCPRTCILKRSESLKVVPLYLKIKGTIRWSCIRGTS